MFTSGNFIFNYATSDRAIRLMDSLGKVVNTINVCSYQKSGVVGNTLFIALEDNTKEYKFQFADSNDAALALGLLRQAVNTLKINCNDAPPVVSSGLAAPISVSYLQYKVLQQTNALVPLQWYDVTDTTNLVFQDAVYVIRVLAKTTDDSFPRGQVLTSRIYVAINTLTDRILSYEDPLNYNMALDSKIVSTNCHHLEAHNDSMVNATNSSYITAHSNSIVNATNCNNVSVRDSSNLVLVGVSNCSFDNIQTTLSNISNINVDRNTSIGCNTNNVFNNPAGTFNLAAYIDAVSQEFRFTGDNNVITVNLSNPIPEANGTFFVKYTGTGINNTIIVNNSVGSLLYTIQENNKGSIVKFAFNKVTNLFELASNGQASTSFIRIQPTAVNNQTAFDINYPVTDASKLEMYINGAKLITGLDYSYNSSTKQLVYNARQYSISSTDEIEIKVY